MEGQNISDGRLIIEKIRARSFQSKWISLALSLSLCMWLKYYDLTFSKQNLFLNFISLKGRRLRGVIVIVLGNELKPSTRLYVFQFTLTPLRKIYVPLVNYEGIVVIYKVFCWEVAHGRWMWHPMRLELALSGLLAKLVAEPISESTPQINFCLMRASSDNQRQWKRQRGKVINQQEW